MEGVRAPPTGKDTPTMMRSMFAGVSGLRNHQTMMDVIATNISNVNTFGYKSQRATFKDSLYQNLSGAAAPTAGTGGTNGKQVGLGMTLNSIDNIITQGNSQSTGVVTDMMIQGDGFFRVAVAGSTFGGVGGNDRTAGGEIYTRAGNFGFDAAGHLVTTDGLYVLGTVAGTGNEGRLQVDPANTAAINVDGAGVVTAIDTAGVATTIGTLSLAKFSNSAGLERLPQDELSAASHERAAKAQKDGLFDNEIVPVEVPQRKGDPVVVALDEGVRGDTTVESLGSLRPAFDKAGNITAGNASQISDGGAAVIVISKAKAEALGATPLGEIVGYGQVAGPDPSLLTQPARAIKAAAEDSGLAVGDIDVVELNEAFAAQVIPIMDECDIPLEKLNTHGGAIALGHPVGATGSVIITKLLHELIRVNGRYGLATMCIGGGQGIAVIFERI